MEPSPWDAVARPADLVLVDMAREMIARIRPSLEVPLALAPTTAAADALTDLVDFTAFANVPLRERQALLVAASKVPSADRAAGALVGLAIGDSLGAPFEFLPAVDTPGSSGVILDGATFCCVAKTLPESCGPGRTLQAGQWTDDTSMALCLADSLLAGRYNGSDIRVRFRNWWEKGYNNGFRKDTSRASRRSIGLGGNVGKSLVEVKDGTPPPRYITPSTDSGNGSLMRLAPVPLAFSRDASEAASLSAESSRTTHPGECAAAACYFLGFLICRALARPDGQNVQQFLDSCADDYLQLHARPRDAELRRLLSSHGCDGDIGERDCKERCWNWRAPSLEIEASLAARSRDGNYNGYPVSSCYFGSYCMDGLAVALHCAYHSTSFADAVVRCVNFLGDADSTSAICGQIVGALYGLQGIDSRLVERLNQWDDMEVACRAVLLWALGAEADPIEDILMPQADHVDVVLTPEVCTLQGMGFSAAEADAALRRANGNLEHAAELLICGD